MTRGAWGRSPGGDRLNDYEDFTELVDRFNQPNLDRRRRIAMLIVLFAVLVFVLVGLVFIGAAQ